MFWTAFTIGLLGSLHCVGMCGPIACALPAGEQSPWKTAGNLLLYNSGRIATYIFLGLLIGVLGKGLFMAGLQRWLSIGAGAFLLVVVLFSIPVENKLLQSPWTGRFYIYLKQRLARLLHGSGAAHFLQVGILNGFLPCGLVYMAFLGALSAGSIAGGALYMLLFGLGTIPLMFSAALAGRRLGIRFQHKLRKFYPVFLTGLALLFILRGLQFDLPRGFTFWEAIQNTPMCH
ncbi:MAG TPA: sulfite exporter TauE/SafE family protein [Flavilitoribacter sp.]|nr:sulfite exporter TauE/SafE family protein [Flavilitoribacter sp.]HMQ89349.1 sulfite exporter TauE/SafE family protein [Flavilitoribacter sp.]